MKLLQLSVLFILSFFLTTNYLIAAPHTYNPNVENAIEASIHSSKNSKKQARKELKKRKK